MSSWCPSVVFLVRSQGGAHVSYLQFFLPLFRSRAGADFLPPAIFVCSSCVSPPLPRFSSPLAFVLAWGIPCLCSLLARFGFRPSPVVAACSSLSRLILVGQASSTGLCSRPGDFVYCSWFLAPVRAGLVFAPKVLWFSLPRQDSVFRAAGLAAWSVSSPVLLLHWFGVCGSQGSSVRVVLIPS
jgi:hypothetical protein